MARPQRFFVRLLIQHRRSRLSQHSTVQYRMCILRSHKCHRVDLPPSSLPAPSWSLNSATPALCDCRPAKAYRISYRLRYPAVGLFFDCLATPPIGSGSGSPPTGLRPMQEVHRRHGVSREPYLTALDCQTLPVSSSFMGIMDLRLLSPLAESAGEVRPRTVEVWER